MSEKKYSINNMLLAFIAVVIVIGLVALAGFFLLSPPDDIIMGQAEATQVRISGKVPGRIEAYRFGEGDHVHAGDTLVYLYTPEVDAKLKQAEAVQSAAQAQNAKAMAGARSQEVTGAYELWQKAKAGKYAADVLPIKKITATGENRLWIDFQSPGILNLYSLAFPIVPENSLEKGDPGSINGTGPYRLAEYKRKQTLHLYSAENQLEITLSRTEGTGREAFLNGLTDIYFTPEFPWFSFSGETLRNIFKFPGRYFYYMGFQAKSGLMINTNIRRYLMSKLDREFLYKNAFLNHMIEQKLPYYRGKEWESELPETPAAVNALDESPIPPGQKLTLLYPADDRSLAILAQNIKEEWEAYIGMETVGLAEAEYTAALQAGQFDVYLAKMPVGQYPNLPELLASTGR